jgi:hypothetical protein
MTAKNPYFAKYYEENREAVLDKKKERYKNDPEYRNKIKEASKARRQALAEEKKRLGIPRKKKGDSPLWFRIQVGNEEVPVRMYTVGQLAKRLGRKPQTIRVWESNGLIPEAMYRNTAKDRLYTELQIKLILAAYDLAEEMYGVQKVSNRIGETNFSKNVWAIWEKYPLGIEHND